MTPEVLVDLLRLFESEGIEVWLCGYVLTEKHLGDMELLRARFGVKLPPHLRRNKSDSMVSNESLPNQRLQS